MNSPSPTSIVTLSTATVPSSKRFVTSANAISAMRGILLEVGP